MLDRELIERHIVIDRVDDPLAPTPGMRPDVVPFVTVTIAVMSRVEPVLAPPLAVVWLIKQPFHQIVVRRFRSVRQKLVDCLRRRRQANQIQMDPPQQRGAIRFWRRSDIFRCARAIAMVGRFSHQ